MIKQLSKAMSSLSSVFWKVTTWKILTNSMEIFQNPFVKVQDFQSIKTFLTWTKSVTLIQEWFHLFLKCACHCLQLLPLNWNTLCLCWHVPESLLSDVPKQSKKHSPKSFIDCQVTCNCSNLDFYLNSAAWPITGNKL